MSVGEGVGGFFQSAEVVLCQVFIPAEASYSCVSALGELGLVQFRDLNKDVNSFQRRYTCEIRRCDEVERNIRYLKEVMKADGIPIMDTSEEEYPATPLPGEMNDLEALVDKNEGELREVNENSKALKKNLLELTELFEVLKKAQGFFGDRGESTTGVVTSVEETTFSAPIATSGQNVPPQLGFVAGVIHRERLAGFERLLWRVGKGLLYLRHADVDVRIENPATGDFDYKSVFIIFFQGDQLKGKMKKICEAFKATVYPCPETYGERKEMMIGVKHRIRELNTVIKQTNDHRTRLLLYAAKQVWSWEVKVKKLKAVSHILNMFSVDVTERFLVGEAWVPQADIEAIQDNLRSAWEKSCGGSGSSPLMNQMEIPAGQSPPTFHRVNRFTCGFQNLVDAYGIASYREVNPAPYTIITFPFLFAIMFGDAGHAVLMLAFGIWMVLREQSLIKVKSSNEIWNIFFGGRYIILLMGLFSFYTGIVYNDVFSKSINVFGSYWYVNVSTHHIAMEKEVMLDPKTNFYGRPYPIGVDPVWQLADNKISFLNGYKMKISIIHGVIHMLFGVMLSLWNHVYFRRAINIYFEFIPQIIFMISLFLYLCILVFHKWVWYGAKTDIEQLNEHCAPSILITFINMVLFKQTEIVAPGCDMYMYSGQGELQKALVIIAAICVPFMLFVKPYILKARNKKEMEARGASTDHACPSDDIALQVEGEQQAPNGKKAPAPSSSADHGHGHGEEFDFSEIFIHQAIHTIEYVLGSVSHTASYLRLWALSLAHAQLSEVLWSMVMRIGLAQSSYSGCIVLYFIFAAWAVLTVSILVLMEGLSAFLHTLRLHWVEFQSKFYTGQGYLFEPFSLKQVIAGGDGDDGN